jgi:beta-glucosidase/6-phospho-beta-glucosidase/beta-galactosidase
VGFTKVRWPALWEHTAPDGLRHADWRWCDATLPLLRDHGIEPIIGLVHHGSGPVSTDLLDDEFGNELAEYAAAFASRYPWIRLYTPINEPLTTARFSALYGHWYPHRRDDAEFLARWPTRPAPRSKPWRRSAPQRRMRNSSARRTPGPHAAPTPWRRRQSSKTSGGG